MDWRGAGRGGILFFVLAATSLIGIDAAVLSCADTGGAFSSSDAAGSLNVDGLSLGPDSTPAECSFLIGSGNVTTLYDLSVDFDSGVGVFIYDGRVPAPETLVLRLAGFAQSFLPLEGPGSVWWDMPMQSRSGFFYIRFITDFDSFRGAGLTASWSSTPSPLPPPLPSGPRGSVAMPSRTVSVGSAVALAAALAVPSVSAVVLTAHINLTGVGQLVVTGRAISVQGRCSQPPQTAEDVPDGGCVIDAALQSRHFLIIAGGSLALSSLALHSGTALQGGSIFALGATFAAQDCVFSGSSSLGDGGAVLGLAGSSVSLLRCSFAGSASIGGLGGAVAAIGNSTLSVRSCDFTGCTAQDGGAVGLQSESYGTVSLSTFSTVYAAGYGGCISAERNATLALDSSTFESCACDLYGGGFYCYYNSSCALADNTWDGAVALAGAGGGYVQLSNITLIRNTFRGCSSAAFGSVMQCYFGNTLFLDSEALDNFGGAMSVYGAANTQAPAWCTQDWCKYTRLTIRGSAFVNNSAIFSTGSGGFLNSVGSGVMVSIENTLVANNTAGGSGGALFFKSGMSSLQMQNVTFEGNSAPRCGAADIRSARQIVIKDTVFNGNSATDGDGGGLCVAPLPPLSGLATCVSDQLLKMYEPTGYLAAVPTQQQAPNVDMHCTWDLLPPPGCQIELDLLLISQLPPLTAALAVFDKATGRELYSDDSTTGILPPPILSSSSRGLRVEYNSSNSINQVPFSGGLAAAWHSICPTLAGALETSGSPLAAAIAAPLGDAALLGGFTLVVLERVTASANTANAGQGGFLYVDMQSGLFPTESRARLALVSVESSVVTGNSALGGSGGGMYVAASKLGMRNVSFSYNTASGAGSSGGGLSVSDANGPVSVDSVRFVSNSATVSGGGLFARESTVQVNSSVFLRNAAASGEGGALFVEASGAETGFGVSVVGSALSLNSAGASGGALAFEGLASVTVRDSNFTLNDASVSGGCLFFFADLQRSLAAVSVSRSIFANCTASSASSSAVLRVAPSTATASGAAPPAAALVMHSTTASVMSGGGAVSLTGASLELADCQFMSNIAEADGAAIAVRHARSASVLRSSFTQNTATGPQARGGAVILWNISSAVVADSVLADNAATSDGGALFVYAQQPNGSAACSLSQSALLRNRAGGNGGALATSGNVSMLVQSAQVEAGAAAGAGGCVALGAGGASLTLRDSSLARCRAGSAQTASPIISAPSALPVSSTACEGAGLPTAVASSTGSSDGGALWLARGATAVLSRTSVIGGSAAGSGGGAWVSMQARLSVLNSTLTGCSALRAGGAFALAGASSAVTLDSSSAFNNSAGSGGFLAFMTGAAAASSTISLRSAMISGNVAVAGSLYALVDGRVTFPEPTCEGICAISTLPATSYGERVASQPATVAVSGPADPVRPGAEFSVVARLFDAFSQPVREYNKVLVTLSCVTQYNPPGAPGSPPSALAGGAGAGAGTGGGPAADPTECFSSSVLLGHIIAVFSDGRAELTALSLRGAPRTVFGMAVTAGEGPIALTAAFNVSVAACDPIEVYNPGTGQCQCLAGFVASNVTGARAACRCPSGYNFVEAGQAGSPPSCRLPPTRRFGRLTDAAFIGIVVGSFVFLLCALTLGASEFSKRKERQLWQDELASEKELLRALQSRLAAADGESDVADSSLDMLRKLYPLATGIALAIFAEGGIPEVSLCKTHAVTGAGSKALQSSLPVAAKPGAGKPGAGASCAATEAGSSQDGSMSRRSVVAGSTSTLSVVVELSKGGKGVAMRGTSVEWVNERQTLADSRDFTDGVRAFPDWAAAAGRGGLKSQRAVTAPITAGPVTLGVVVLHFQTSRPGRAERSLLEFCKAVGGALFVRRTLVGLVYDSNAQPSDANTGREFGNSSLRSGFPVSSRKQSASGRSFLSSQLPTLDDTAAWDKLDAEGPAMRARLTAWNLDAWQINTEELCLLAIHMFHSLGLVRRFSIRVALLQEFLEEVASHYWDNPFHNYRHAWTVAHTAWRFASMSAELQGMLHDLDKLALLLSSLCHDLEHPGTTNAFQINTGSDLALVYNDVHVLLLEETKVLSHLPLADRKLLRKLMVDAILSTDMAQHKDLVARVQKHGNGELPPLRAELIDDRLVLVSLLLHCADLHTPTLEPHISKRVADSLSDEFEAQADTERAAGLQVTVMLPSANQSKAALEIGFIQFVVRPLFGALVNIAPDLAIFLDRVDATLAMWNAHQMMNAPPPSPSGDGGGAGGRRSSLTNGGALGGPSTQRRGVIASFGRSSTSHKAAPQARSSVLRVPDEDG